MKILNNSLKKPNLKDLKDLNSFNDVLFLYSTNCFFKINF